MVAVATNRPTRRARQNRWPRLYWAQAPGKLTALCLAVLLCLAAVACVNKVRPTQEAEEKFGIATPATDFKPVVPSHMVPLQLKPAYQKLVRGGERHAVLNYMHLGMDAMQTGDTRLAAACFDAAISLVETVFSDSPNVAKARSLWYSEGQKEFKGEPYERAMLFIYRGILYAWAGDLENARACFQNAELQDAFAAEDVYRCDFALAMALEGWCSLQLADRQQAQENFSRAKKLRPDWHSPQQGQNVLFLFETGKSPRKLADGLGHSELKFFRGKHFRDKRVAFELNQGLRQKAYPMEDVAWQAMTRGGREVDKILAGKAHYVQETSRFGTTLTKVTNSTLVYTPLLDGGTGIATAIVGGISLIGVASLASAANANPWADVRYWRNLPDMVHWKCMRLDPGQYTLKVYYLDKAGRNISSLNQTIHFQIKAGNPLIVWTRSIRTIVQ